eukprot:TRINITY_DN1639_c0_g1_i1.p2 TRINITY_DN1639_c0_g1~~TRINITY_DN1639_c0_g1_i1.p2  ORF type:complete len:492 (+),score=112.89 TRINITY_DN1639_c0_g1_i1:3872-5347(+)
MFPRPPVKAPIAGRGAYPAPPVKKKVAPHVVKETIHKPETKTVIGNFPVAELPYHTKERRVIEHRVRCPHRRYLPDDLLSVTAFWTDQPTGKLPWKEGGGVVTKSDAKGSGILPVTTPTITSDRLPTCVNVRALIVPAIEGDSSKTITKRIQVIAASSENSVSCYGGLLPDAKGLSDDELTARLAALVKEQSGADLAGVKWVKVLHLEYDSNSPTIFYAPILPSSPVPVFSPQVTPSTPDCPEDVYHVSPIRFNLAALVDYQVHSSTPRDALEFFMAADALHEWGKRDMAEKILEVLRIRGEESKKKSGEDLVMSEKLGATKRKRDEELTARKKVRDERDVQMKQKWCDEDEGKTDEQKRAVMRQRQEILKEIRAKDVTEDSQRESAWSEEDKTNDTTANVVKQKIQKIDPLQLEAFQYFDRQNEGSITRLSLQNVLLCTMTPITIAQIDTLLSLPHLPKRQEHLPYRKLAAQTIERLVEVPPPEVPTADV